MPGQLGPGVRDAVEVAVSWAASQLKPLWRWLGHRPGGSSKGGGEGGRRRRRCAPAVLWRSSETLMVSFSSSHGRCLEGMSLGPATALSLVAMATRRRVKQTVAVTGLLDLSGNVLGVAGLRAKLRACLASGIETLLVPQETMAELSSIEESLPADLRDYAYRAVRGVSTMLDVIQLSIQGRSMRPAGLPACLSRQLVPQADGVL